MKYGISGMLALAVALVATGAGYAQTTNEQALKVFEANKEAVVTVHVVSKASMGGMMGGGEDEMVTEATGTVISEDGLTVVSLSATDPSTLISNMMGPMGDQFQMQVETISVDILQTDGSEIKAEIVLRDKDLDLAYVRPEEKPAEPMPFVDLSTAGEAGMLEELVTINRLGKVANRVHAASFERVNAIVEKPRRFYIPGNDPSQTNAGSPAFKLDGTPLGVFVIRSIKSSAQGIGSMFSGMTDNVVPIILPASDILEGAAQAPPFEGAAAE